MRITRRTLQIGLGLIWLLDGALQLQPYMFGSGFARAELAPAGAGQPGIVEHPVHWASQLVLTHPTLFNSGFAAIQLLIGIGLLRRRSVRVALAGSIVWGLSIWLLGEGLGGLTTGETLLSGAPGAALLYAVISTFAFPRDGDSAVAPSAWALPTWAAIWVGAAGLQLAAGNNSGASFAGMFTDAKSDNGGCIGRIDGHLGRVHYSNAVVAALIAAEVLIALWAFVPGRIQQLSFVAGSALILASWFLIQGLGDLTTGQATDPNAGPLLILLGLAAYGSRESFAHQLSPSIQGEPCFAPRLSSVQH